MSIKSIYLKQETIDRINDLRPESVGFTTWVKILMEKGINITARENRILEGIIKQGE